MDAYIILVYALKVLIIVASVLGFLLAKALVPEVKELLTKKIDKNKKMWFLIIVLPIIYVMLGNVSRYFRIHSGVSFDPFLIVVVLWIFGIYFGTKLILSTDIEENKIRLGKFITIYSIATIVFMGMIYLISAFISATNGY